MNVVDRAVFDGLAERFAGRPVQSCVDGDLDAETLAVRSACVSTALTGAGVGRGHVVAVKGRRDSWLFPVLLGILEAGAAYTVIPFNSPDDVERRLLETLQPAALVVWDDVVAPRWRGRTPIPLSETVSLVPGPAVAAGAQGRVADDAAYVIATSGTSGTPKAVLVSHRAVLAFLDAARDVVDPSDDDVVAARSSAAFDLSVWELFGSAIAGVTAVLIVESVAADTDRLHDLLVRTEATILSTTPSAAYRLGSHDRAVGGGLALRRLLVGGEASDGLRLADVMSAPSFTECRLDNWYGPTEATVSCTGGELDPSDLAANRTPIGPALRGVKTVIVARGDDPGLGELAVGGDQLALGYLGNPRATAAAFVPDPDGAGERLYLTGDTVSTDDTDRFVYHGRSDGQVQLRGYRLELSEVERVLAAQDKVRWCHATVGGTDSDVLIAYFATREDGPVDRASLWAELYRRLPRHAVPAALVAVTDVPLTVGEKLDVARLPGPVVGDYVAGATAGAPAETATEHRLVGLWQQLLGIDDIGTNHHFFALGGHSLLVARMVNGIAREFGVRVALADVIDGLTVREIASVIEEKQSRLPAVASAAGGGREELTW